MIYSVFNTTKPFLIGLEGGGGGLNTLQYLTPTPNNR